MFGRLLFKLLNDIESRINELRRSARPTSDEVEALPPKPADAVAHLLDQPFNITCPNCKHEFHETFRWLEANESVKCPDCNATLVLEFKDRGTLTKLQSSFAELQTSLAGLQETVGKFNRHK